MLRSRGAGSTVYAIYMSKKDMLQALTEQSNSSGRFQAAQQAIAGGLQTNLWRLVKKLEAKSSSRVSVSTALDTPSALHCTIRASIARSERALWQAIEKVGAMANKRNKRNKRNK
jgi:hypothetical protein